MATFKVCIGYYINVNVSLLLRSMVSISFVGTRETWLWSTEGVQQYTHSLGAGDSIEEFGRG